MSAVAQCQVCAPATVRLFKTSTISSWSGIPHISKSCFALNSGTQPRFYSPCSQTRTISTLFSLHRLNCTPFRRASTLLTFPGPHPPTFTSFVSRQRRFLVLRTVKMTPEDDKPSDVQNTGSTPGPQPAEATDQPTESITTEAPENSQGKPSKGQATKKQKRKYEKREMWQEKGEEEGKGKRKGKGKGKKEKKPPLTHFLCIPLVTNESRPLLEEALRKFESDVVNNMEQSRTGSLALKSGGVKYVSEGHGKHEKGFNAGEAENFGGQPQNTSVGANPEPLLRLPSRAVRPVGTLHLTLGVMSLTTPERVQKAVDVLNDLNIVHLLDGKTQEQQRELEQGTETTQEHHEDEEDGGVSLVSPPGVGASHDPSEKDQNGKNEIEMELAPEPNMQHPHPDTPPIPNVVRRTPNAEDEDQPSSDPQHFTRAASTAPFIPLSFTIRSLVPMKSPKKTTVLYAFPEDSTNRLLPLGTAVRDTFTDNGVMIPDDRPLKLHATIVNTIYARPGGRRGDGMPENKEQVTGENVQIGLGVKEGDNVEAASESEQEGDEGQTTVQAGPTEGVVAPENDEAQGREQQSIPSKEPSRQGERLSAAVRAASSRSSQKRRENEPVRFNATEVVEKYKEFVWAENVRVQELAICKMGATKIYGEDGSICDEQYEKVASIPFPES
ncbi:hypothetical protein BDY21DRAFT_335230 [Lineolata rhizophorae]|uniref:A-kinase anchor protein 7-like phosphoesterase domain-containing protein n=1 Tax=Lineolata rhizophorae TaxID=578093 RepID=A0A6A6P928_9PEZI|nr:hypothetical protein BDY21DRAFT_335230 [Lineolata rhizophorae]